MGGHNPKSRIVAALCQRCHNNTDTIWGNEVLEYPDLGLYYVVWQITPYKVLVERVIGEVGRSADEASAGLSAVSPHVDSPSPARLSDHPVEAPEMPQEGDDADRETATGMHGETDESREETQHRTDEAFPEESGSGCDPLHGMDGWTTPERLPLGEPELDGAGMGGPGPGEPTNVDAIATYQIGDTGEKAPPMSDGGVEAAMAVAGFQSFRGTDNQACARSRYEALSDEELALLYADADRWQRQGFLYKCAIIYTYRERHVQHWGQSWIEQAYELFEGAPSRRTLEAYANIWQICTVSDVNLTEQIGPLTDSRSLMQFIGRKKPEMGRVALEAAVAYVAEYGEPPTVAALTHKLGEEHEAIAPARPECAHKWVEVTVCEKCGKREETNLHSLRRGAISERKQGSRRNTSCPTGKGSKMGA
jgi:hypothetical protein